MNTSDKNKKKFLEAIREELKEELDAHRRAHREVLARERDEVRKISLREMERFKKRKPSYILRVLRRLSWVS